MLTAGTVVADHLRLIRQLGSGGMGSVWIAEQTRIGQHVAVKFLSTALLDHESARSRFDREAKLAARIKSPHVVQIHDHGLTRSEPAIPYIVMELLDGQDLSKVLESEGPLSPGRAFEVLSQVCDALTKAHEAGIVHRDIKPENVFMLNESRTFVKLLDFGVAHGKDGQIDRLTQTGLLLGTAHYMSPEQLFSGKDIDHRADLWALAVLTYQMLSNELPFQAETFGQLCLRVRDGGFAPLSSLIDVPPGMDQWFTRGLCTDRVGRFQSAAEMAESFRKVLAFEAGSSQAGSANKPRENTGTVRVERGVIERGLIERGVIERGVSEHAREEARARGEGAKREIAKTERWGSQPGTSPSGSNAVGSSAGSNKSSSTSGFVDSGAALSRGTLPSGEHAPFLASGSRPPSHGGLGPNTPLSALEGSFGTEARGALAFNADSDPTKPAGRTWQWVALAGAAVLIALGGVMILRANADSSLPASDGPLSIGAGSSADLGVRAPEVGANVVVAPTALAIEPLPDTESGDAVDVETSETTDFSSVSPSASVGNTVIAPVVRPHTVKVGATQKVNASSDGKAPSKVNADVASDNPGVGGKPKPEEPKKPEKKYRGF